MYLIVLGIGDVTLEFLWPGEVGFGTCRHVGILYLPNLPW